MVFQKKKKTTQARNEILATLYFDNKLLFQEI